MGTRMWRSRELTAKKLVIDSRYLIKGVSWSHLMTYAVSLGCSQSDNYFFVLFVLSVSSLASHARLCHRMHVLRPFAARRPPDGGPSCGVRSFFLSPSFLRQA